MIRTFGALPLAACTLLAGCATQSLKIHDANKNPSVADLQCHAMHLTGSLFLNTVCLTQADRDAQKAAIDDLQNTVERNTNACGISLGCAVQN